jgi:hypothetical protein
VIPKDQRRRNHRTRSDAPPHAEKNLRCALQQSRLFLLTARVCHCAAFANP